MWRPDLSWLQVGASFQEGSVQRSESSVRLETTSDRAFQKGSARRSESPAREITPAGASVTSDNMLTVDVEGQLLTVGAVDLEALDFVLGGKPLVEAPPLRYWRQKRSRPKERKHDITIDLSSVDPTIGIVPGFVSFSLAQIDEPFLRPSVNDYLRCLAERDDPAAWITVTFARAAGMDQTQRLEQWQGVSSRFPDCASVTRALLDCQMDDRTANCRDLLNALKSQALRTHSYVLTELIAAYLRTCVLLGDLSGLLQMASCLVQSWVLRQPPKMLVDPCAFGLSEDDGTMKKQLEPLSPPRAVPATRYDVQTTEAGLEIWALLQPPNSLAEEVVFHIENSDSRPLLGVPLGLSWGIFASLPLEEVLRTIGIGRLVSHHPAIVRRQWYLGSASSFWEAPESSPLRVWLESDLSMHSVAPSDTDQSFASMVLGCMWPVFSACPTLFLGHHLLCALFSFPKTSRPLVQAVLQRSSESPTILLTFAACLLKAGDKALLEARKVLLSLMQRLGCARHVALAWAYLEAIRSSPDLGLVSAVLESANSRDLTDLSRHVLPSGQLGVVTAVHGFTACPAFPPDGEFAHKASTIMCELCDHGIMAAMKLLLLALGPVPTDKSWSEIRFVTLNADSRWWEQLAEVLMCCLARSRVGSGAKRSILYQCLQYFPNSHFLLNTVNCILSDFYRRKLHMQLACLGCDAACGLAPVEDSRTLMPLPTLPMLTHALAGEIRSQAPCISWCTKLLRLACDRLQRRSPAVWRLGCEFFARTPPSMNRKALAFARRAVTNKPLNKGLRYYLATFTLIQRDAMASRTEREHVLPTLTNQSLPCKKDAEWLHAQRRARDLMGVQVTAGAEVASLAAQLEEEVLDDIESLLFKNQIAWFSDILRLLVAK